MGWKLETGATLTALFMLAGCATGIHGPGRKGPGPVDPICEQNVAAAAKRLGPLFIDALDKADGGPFVVRISGVRGTIQSSCANASTLPEAHKCLGAIRQIYSKSKRRQRDFIPDDLDRDFRAATGAYQAMYTTNVDRLLGQNQEFICLPAAAASLKR